MKTKTWISIHTWSDNTFQAKVANRPLSSLHEGHLKLRIQSLYVLIHRTTHTYPQKTRLHNWLHNIYLIFFLFTLKGVIAKNETDTKRIELQWCPDKRQFPIYSLFFANTSFNFNSNLRIAPVLRSRNIPGKEYREDRTPPLLLCLRSSQGGDLVYPASHQYLE